MEKYKNIIDNYLDRYFHEKGTHNKVIYDAMAYSVRNGGKRIRPILMIMVYNLYKDNFEDILPIASAMEFIHTYSLIHDDLPCMDDDDLRRGKPTCHKVFGEDIAVLAGDGLLNEAMNVMFTQCLKGNMETLKACSLISQSSGTEGMIGGQVVDVISEGKKVDEKTLLYMHENKTGALIKASVLAGAILGGANDDELQLLEKFAYNLGIAFQIKDDILDVTGDTETLGKPVNSDIENNKSTFITTYGLEQCKSKCEKLTKDAINLLLKLNKNTSELETLTMFLLDRNY